MHGIIGGDTDRLLAFQKRFNFRKEMSLKRGIERECFLVDDSNTLVPAAPRALEYIHSHSWRLTPHGHRAPTHISNTECVGYELSATQLETRTPPHAGDETEDYLRYIDVNLRAALRAIGLKPLYREVAPEDMSLDVFPDPTGRYAHLAAAMPREVLQAACRIIGTHVHIGMPDHETALRVYNAVVESIDTLMEMGDGSDGERLRIYGIVRPDNRPRPYTSWLDFCNDAHENGFADEPRNNWRMIRITKYGTIEFRPFGATESIDRICAWAKLCHVLCKKAMT